MASPLAVAASGARAATKAVSKKDQNKPAPISQLIRQAGVGGITKQELNQITKSSGKTAGTVIQRLDEVNKNLRAKDKAGISLNSGAANMLIRQQSKAQSSPVAQYMSKLGISQPAFGGGRIGSVLQARAAGTDILGRAGNLMIGGTAIRPGGRETVRGFGKQYELPKPVTTEEATTPTEATPATPEPVVQDPMTPEEMQDASTVGPGMLSGGGMGAAGANKLGRAKSRLRQLGIYGRGTGLLGRGLQYGNALNK